MSGLEDSIENRKIEKYKRAMEKVRNMDRDKLKQLGENAIEEYFEGIDPVIEDIVSKIVEEHKIEDEDDIDYLEAKIRLGILKWEE